MRKFCIANFMRACIRLEERIVNTLKFYLILHLKGVMGHMLSYNTVDSLLLALTDWYVNTIKTESKISIYRTKRRCSIHGYRLEFSYVYGNLPTQVQTFTFLTWFTPQIFGMARNHSNHLYSIFTYLTNIEIFPDYLLYFHVKF
jgi:hypothetical protein